MTTKEPPQPPSFQSGPSHDLSVLSQVLENVEKPKSQDDSDQSQPQSTKLTPTSIVYQDLEDISNFKSALSYANVRDFAYPIFHPLHYGVPDYEHQSNNLNIEEEDDDDEADEDNDEYNNNYNDHFDDGPPWQQDSDLNSPIIKSHEVGDRISKEYQFSVASADEIHGRAVALFDFTPENDNEAPLQEGQIVWISYRHGQGWLVAEDPETGETGLVPEEYVQLLNSMTYEEGIEPDSEPAIYQSPESDSEGWVDEDSELVDKLEGTKLDEEGNDEKEQEDKTKTQEHKRPDDLDADLDADHLDADHADHIDADSPHPPHSHSPHLH